LIISFVTGFIVELLLFLRVRTRIRVSITLIRCAAVASAQNIRAAVAKPAIVSPS
jgi:hypothetical protein